MSVEVSTQLQRIDCHQKIVSDNMNMLISDLPNMAKLIRKTQPKSTHSTLGNFFKWITSKK